MGDRTSRKTKPADLAPSNGDNGRVVPATTPVPRSRDMMPPNLVLTERATADFRAWLAAEGCGHWTVFHTGDDEFYELDQHLPALAPEGEDADEWQPGPPLTSDTGEQPAIRNDDGDAVLPGAFYRPGFLRLREWGVAVARWYWIDPEYNSTDMLWVAAAESREAYDGLRDKIKELRHAGNVSVWQVVRGSAAHDGPRVKRRRNAGKELVLNDELRKQIDRDVLGFFKPSVRRLYKKLAVPYRRGVLLHGPPGNGKTSLIRMVGARLPKIPFLLLRPDRQINAGQLRAIIDRWQRQAPAVLVIEDLNWLLEQVDVSAFLNLIDGIERETAKGLLLLATTNYPEKLDPAVNNRPGRFDVVVELPNPDEGLRRAFFDKNFGDAVSAETRETAAKKADGLSFAHLREVLRLSGLIAIEDGRADRGDADVLRAVELVWQSHDRAVRGFPKTPDLPFGLQHQKRR